MPNAARIVRLIHAALFGGVVIAAVVVALALGRAAPPPQLAPVALYALPAAAVAALLLAALVLRPRIPERASGDSPDAYWARPEVRAAAVTLWAVIEGAGLIGVVGYVITGRSVMLIVTVIAVAAGVVFRPGNLEG